MIKEHLALCFKVETGKSKKFDSFEELKNYGSCGTAGHGTCGTFGTRGVSGTIYSNIKSRRNHNNDMLLLNLMNLDR